MIQPFNATILTEKILPGILTVFDQIRDVPRMYDAAFEADENTCRTLSEHVHSEKLKIAVVGVIKSGKSTLVNSLIGKDIVKRGAGIITSLTTKIRKGTVNKGTVYFKSWDRINQQLADAIRMFPSEQITKDIPEPFDIRRKNDRKLLKEIYDAIGSSIKTSGMVPPPEFLMMHHALEGFESCESLVKADDSELEFTGKAFDRHKEFTADADKAFYVDDVCLELWGNAVEPDIEIADCQGADSPDVSTLSKVLAYLESAHLIIYCISSRNGLRHSDTTFLGQIRKMGLLNSVLFVNNCDFSEHEDIRDLKKIEAAIKQDLNFIGVEPEIYSFSALYHLFSNRKTALSDKEISRWNIWQSEKEMISYCDAHLKRFHDDFNGILSTSRREIMISGHLSRIRVMLNSVLGRCEFFLNVLSTEKVQQEKAVEDLEQLHENAIRLESIVNHSIPGAVAGLKTAIDEQVLSFFADDSRSILSGMRDHIQSLQLDLNAYKNLPDDAGFRKMIYLMFQDFKREVDLYVIENVMPEIKKVVRELENESVSHFQALLDSYKVDLAQPQSLLLKETDEIDTLLDTNEALDMKMIRQILGVKIPGMVFKVQTKPAEKIKLFTGFGLQSFTGIVSALFDKRTFSFSTALQRAYESMKQGTLKDLNAQFVRYRKYLQAGYIHPMVDAAAREFERMIHQRFGFYNTYKDEIEKLIQLKESEKKEEKSKVLKIKADTEKLLNMLSKTAAGLGENQQENG